ncbi:cellulose synthase subunit BcsC-related outer membrane protein [Xylophilus sp. GOD-11R]|uniref:cellulose synthase subunit BcsC-related outer membrane protein n=1 Tax=Xylophilus sp. GOD-11R TaxID=3089814 RepID=UPI00298BF7C4|nr:cellulose synthase subunit BcsC-related outer membrane protein [Xylophilus sp. GOD-11R]WPB56948.1 cellulose synthase subunit BcsC-related outer membrane protein [Xylophilus sp. GOD-11R]
MHPSRSRTLVLCLLGALQTMPAQAATKRGRAPAPAPAPLEVPLAADPTQSPADTRRELEQRVLEQPGDMAARLALAQLLASQPDTLRSGIVQLSQLARDRTVGAEAIGSWRAALGFAGTGRDDIPLYQAYLKVRPKDTAVRARLAEIQRGTASSPASAPVGRTAAPAPVLTGTPAYMPPVVLPPAGGGAAAVASPAIPAPVVPAPVGVRSSLSTREEVVVPAMPPRTAPRFDGVASTTTPAASSANYAAPPVVARAPESPDELQLRNLQREIADIESQRGRPEVSAGVVVRSRQGERGMSRLTDTEVPIQLRMDMGDGTLTGHVTPVFLGTGRIDTAFNSISRFGGGPVVATAQPGASAGGQNQQGLGVGVGYEQGNLAVDIGTTPIGFRYTDVNGGVRYRMPVSEEFSFTMNLQRRAVTDSVLSFAGARDARTGQEWGGVSSNGARLDANYDRGGYGLYAYGGVARLLGHGVETNTRAEYGAGIFFRLINEQDTKFTAGLAATGLNYDKNLGYYTLGQGGYFSPQQFLSIGVPVDWQQRTGRMSYQVKGSLGVQHVREDGTPYFPNDAAAQAAAGTSYGGQSKTGIGYSLAAALEYQLEPQWFVGGRLGLDNSRDYRQYLGSLYVRYAFRPHEGPQVMPVNWIRSPYGG